MQQEKFIVKHSNSIIITSIIGIIICIVLIIIAHIINYINKPTSLSLQFAPGNAILTLEDGTTLRTGTYEIEPGHYSGTITANNFKSKSIDFDIVAHEPSSIVDYLVHNSEGLAYFEKSASNLATLRLVTNDSDVDSFLKAYDRKASIYNNLPIEVTWRIDPTDYPTYTLKLTDGNNRPECNTTLCLLGTGPSYDETEVKSTLQENGYNFNDYEVIYEYYPI